MLETLAGDLSDVFVDRVQIETVLHNLLANAIDGLKEQPDPRVVQVLCAVDAESFVRISVEDNGPGIAAEIIDGLFDPFVTTKPRGTGLGLAISRSIIDAHGGRLWHEPRSPGSAFRFTVPAARHAA